MTEPTVGPPVVVEVVRSGLVECRHLGNLLAVDGAGVAVLARGRVDTPMYPRSCNKPLQAVGLLRAGFSQVAAERPDWVALAAASHSGEARHVAAVRGMLAAVGLDERALANTPALPLDEAAGWAVLRSGGGPDRVHQNCSGKHAAMLATCVVAGWRVEGYLHPEHPLQQALRAGVAELAGEPVTTIGVDGCGAPLFALSLRGLARAFARMVRADVGAAERAVADAMRAHPDLVGGTGREATRLMTGLPGAVAKDGAEGVFAAALPDGSAAVLKIEDGAARARTPVLVAGLRALGVDAPVLGRLATVPVLGHGEVVGEVRLAAEA